MAIDSMEHERTAADMNRIPKAGWKLGKMVRWLKEGTL